MGSPFPLLFSSDGNVVWRSGEGCTLRPPGDQPSEWGRGVRSFTHQWIRLSPEVHSPSSCLVIYPLSEFTLQLHILGPRCHAVFVTQQSLPFCTPKNRGIDAQSDLPILAVMKILQQKGTFFGRSFSCRMWILWAAFLTGVPDSVQMRCCDTPLSLKKTMWLPHQIVSFINEALALQLTKKPHKCGLASKVQQ